MYVHKQASNWDKSTQFSNLIRLAAQLEKDNSQRGWKEDQIGKRNRGGQKRKNNRKFRETDMQYSLHCVKYTDEIRASGVSLSGKYIYIYSHILVNSIQVKKYFHSHATG